MIKTLLFFFMCLVASTTSHRFEGIQNTLKEDLELERKLKLINKPSIKSIETKFGDIVDCVDINKQPAFDHPLLKNHKLQIKPSEKISPNKPIFGLENEQCPTGTVPIKRTTKEHLIRGQLFFNNHMLFEDVSHNHVAEVNLVVGSYYGVSGKASIYNPRVHSDQSSGAVMWVRNGPFDDINLIGVGWHVVPQLYNDNSTHIFIKWTSDNFKKTGCFNLLCPGFVQTNTQLYIGDRLDNFISDYGGVRYDQHFALYQDSTTKNWWLQVENVDIGYFPAALFNNMGSANQVGWGGRTTTSVGSPSPPMGSGNFPDNVSDNKTTACYFREVSFQKDDRKDYSPDGNIAQTYSDKSDCYKAEYYGLGDFGYHLQFGGPGGNCGD